MLLPGTHRWAKRRSVRLAELAEEPMVLLDLPHSRDYFQRIFSQRRSHPDRALPLGQRGDLPRAGRPRPGLHGAQPAAEGLGFARGHPVAAVPIPDDAPALSVVLITAANARPTRRAQAIAQLCRDRLSPS